MAKRIKRVFQNAKECIHVWAQLSQDEGRSSNVTFRPSSTALEIGDALYSYNTCIAAFRDTPNGQKVVFLDYYSHSSCTSAHQSAALHSVTQPVYTYDYIPHWVRDDVRVLSGRRGSYRDNSPYTVKPESIWQQYKEIFDALVATVEQRRFSRTACERLNMAREYEAKANRIKRFFNLDNLPDIELVITPQMQEYVDLAEQKKAEKEKREKEKIQRDIERTAIDREKWLTGHCNYFPHAYQFPIALRLSPSDPERVETSRGAFVPVKVCERLYKSFKARQMPDDVRVGNYTLNDVSEQGITIGCHQISANELERFAAVIGIA
jgi:hypothetical protein